MPPAEAASGEIVRIACAARQDYAPHTAAMLHSVLAARDRERVSIHFLHGPELPGEFRAKLQAMVARMGGSISFLEVAPGRLAGLRTRDLLPEAHWYRVFLPELLPGVERVLYLDGDLIALESLAKLWETDLRGNYLGAVTNVFQRDHLDRVAQLGLPDPRRYFNSGVLVMDLGAMRRDDCTSELLAYARANHEVLAWPEQDALNVVLGERRLALHPRWNLMNSIMIFPWASEVLGTEAVAEAIRSPAIRHFEGPTVNKPWHYLCERDGRELYARHRAATPWPSWRPEGATPANRLRRLLRLAVSA